MRILIEGIGGIGGVVSARLTEAGYAPVLVTHNPAITEAVNNEGIRLKTPEGATTTAGKAFSFLDELPQGSQFDAAFLIMKANQVVGAARQSLPFLGRSGYLVTFQNGIVEDAVVEVAGAEQVMSAIIGWGGEMTAPGVYEKTSRGRTYIGELSGEVTERVRELARILNVCAPVRISRNIRGALWSKLAINCMITPLGALTGERLGVMLEDQRARRLFLLIYREAVDTAETLGIRLERVAAPPRLIYLPRHANFLTARFKDLLIQLVGRKYAGIQSSALQSLARGRKTEIDYLNGYVVEKAESAGLAVPVNRRLVLMVKEIEEAKRPIGPGNLSELFSFAA